MAKQEALAWGSDGTWGVGKQEDSGTLPGALPLGHQRCTSVWGQVLAPCVWSHRHERRGRFDLLLHFLR